MPQHASSARDRPLIIGHRGAPGRRPEHTDASYRFAIQTGAEAIEPDVVVSRDGVLVVRHENEIGGTTDVSDHPEFADRRTKKTVDGKKVNGWFVEDFTWTELATLRTRERLPGLRSENTVYDGDQPMMRLRDVLELADDEGARLGHRITVVVELKHPYFLRDHGHDLVALLLAELENCGWNNRPDQLIIECFELAPLEELREKGLAAFYFFLLEHAGSPADQLAGPKGASHTYEWYRSDEGLDSLVGRVDGVSPAKRDILADPDPKTGLVARAHARGLAVFTWTLRPENHFLDRSNRKGLAPSAWGDWRAEWEQLEATGVNGVFVDYPELYGGLA